MSSIQTAANQRNHQYVTGITVKTKDGQEHEIKTPLIVNACGSWAKNVAKMANVDIPLLSYRHAFVVTEKVYDKMYPSIRDYDAAVYMKYQSDCLAIGG